jgi:hypothetical protein
VNLVPLIVVFGIKEALSILVQFPSPGILVNLLTAKNPHSAGPKPSQFKLHLVKFQSGVSHVSEKALVSLYEQFVHIVLVGVGAEAAANASLIKRDAMKAN